MDTRKLTGVAVGDLVTVKCDEGLETGLVTRIWISTYIVDNVSHKKTPVWVFQMLSGDGRIVRHGFNHGPVEVLQRG
jgi:hypothetical protein